MSKKNRKKWQIISASIFASPSELLGKTTKSSTILTDLKKFKSFALITHDFFLDKWTCDNNLCVGANVCRRSICMRNIIVG